MKHADRNFRPGILLLTLALMLLSFFCLRWLLFSVQSDAIPAQKSSSGPAAMASGEKSGRADFAGSMEVLANNSAADALSELVYIKKI